MPVDLTNPLGQKHVFINGDPYFTKPAASTFHSRNCTVKVTSPASSLSLTPDSLLPELLKSDIIVYQLSTGVEDSTNALRLLKNATYTKPKTFILISSVQTWAETFSEPPPPEEDENEEPDQDSFTEENYNKRVPHPKYTQWKELEKQVKVEHSEKKLITYVVWSGLTYGLGEDRLHPFFKQAWHLAAEGLPLFGSSRNVVPMIHIKDLCTFVGRLGVPKVLQGAELEALPDPDDGPADERDPAQRYYFAVDSGNLTWARVIHALNTSMGNGVVHTVPERDFVLYENIEHFMINVKVEANGISNLMPEDEDWVCRSGFSENVDSICREYKEDHGVAPLRVALLGPSQTGKTFYAEKLAQHYHLPVVTIQGVIREYKQQEGALMEELGRLRQEKKNEARMSGEDPDDASEDPDAYDDEAIEAIRTRLEDVQSVLKLTVRAKTEGDEEEKKKRPTGKKPGKKEAEAAAAAEAARAAEAPKYSDRCLAFMYRWKLDQPACRNQGFIMDGFPQTLKQAKLLLVEGELTLDEGEEEEVDNAEEPELKKVEERLLPDRIVKLTAPDQFLSERRSKNQVDPDQPTDYTVTADIVASKGNPPWSEVASYMNSCIPNGSRTQGATGAEYKVDSCPLQPPPKVTSILEEPAQDPLLPELIKFIGAPHNYGPTPEELQENIDKEKAKEMERSRLKAEVEADQRQKEQRDKAELLSRQRGEKELLRTMQEREKEMLEQRKEPLKRYLMDNVMPILTKGLMQVCEERPEDPIDWLSEWLMTHNPQYSV